MAIRRAHVRSGRKLFRVLESGESMWNESNHPELTEGSGASVRQLRRQVQARYAKLERGAQESIA